MVIGYEIGWKWDRMEMGRYEKETGWKRDRMEMVLDGIGQDENGTGLERDGMDMVLNGNETRWKWDRMKI